AELNLPPDIYSHGLRRLTAQEIATNSYEEAMASIERSTGCKIPKLQAEELAAKVSQDFETFYESRQAKIAEDTKDLLVMSLDLDFKKPSSMKKYFSFKDPPATANMQAARNIYRRADGWCRLVS
ncbi:MAG TPA: hypothetical protein VIJ14_04540, partial [Rhabdochlamydiaceae bacterium]